jgi:hypothetical protein
LDPIHQHNPLAVERTEAVSVQVPVCNLAVTEQASGAAVTSQVTAMFGISDGQAPYYDFSLEFIATIPPLGQKVFVVSPAPDAGCHGGDMGAGFVRHARVTPRATDLDDANAPDEELISQAIEVQMARTGGAGFGDPETWMETLRQVAHTRREKEAKEQEEEADSNVTLENPFLKVVVDTTQGIQSVTDKATGKSYQLNHDYVVYDTVQPGSAGDAYVWKPTDEAQYILRDDMGPALNCSGPKDGWKQTAKCDPHGTHAGQPSKSCDYEISWKLSGYCQCGGLVKKGFFGCDSSKKRANFTCTEVCARTGSTKVNAMAATVALGPVMQEVRLQVNNQHKTRIRLWDTTDPTLGYRLEIGHRLGVLEERTDLVSRFYVQELNNSKAMMFSEDNGYELVHHPSGAMSGKKVEDIPDLTYPSQMSAILRVEGETQLSVALERSHGVASLYTGTLDIMQHRRGEPYKGTGGTVVLDDTDRIFTQTWVNVGNQTAANRMRVAMKQQLNHPLTLLFGAAPSKDTVKASSSGSSSILSAIDSLPAGLHLQWARMTGETSRELLIRFQHLFAKGEDPSMSAPRTIDVAQFLASAGLQAKNITEVTLTGFLPKSDLKRQHFPAESAAAPFVAEPAAEGGVGTVVQPYELRTFLVAV